MPDEANDKPKIVVDDDWKAQARAEKEKLSEQAPAAPSGDEADHGPRQLPPAEFTVLVSSLVTQILFALGAIADPQTGQRMHDLDLAKHHVDMLGVLEEKTKGNLTEDEKQVLDRALYESRMHYVQASQAGG